MQYLLDISVSLYECILKNNLIVEDISRAPSDGDFFIMSASQFESSKSATKLKEKMLKTPESIYI